MVPDLNFRFLFLLSACGGRGGCGGSDEANSAQDSRKTQELEALVPLKAWGEGKKSCRVRQNTGWLNIFRLT